MLKNILRIPASFYFSKELKIIPMNTRIINLLMMTLLSVVVVFSSCKKDEEEDDNNNNNNVPAVAPNPTPEFDASDGLLVAINLTSFTTVAGYEVPTEVGLAVAVFQESAGSSTFVDAGTVTCETKTLTKTTANSYYFSAGVADPTGIDFSNDVAWTVSGGSGIPAIDRTASMGWPEISKIKDSPTSIAINTDFTLESNTAINNADSVMFVLTAASGKSVMATEPGGTSAHTFTSSEMTGLSGAGYAQIVAYRWTTYDEGGKNIYYVNEAVVTANVTFQ